VELVVIGVVESGEQFVEQVEQLRCGLIGELRLGKPERRVGLVHVKAVY
jgi:hypothetical protein